MARVLLGDVARERKEQCKTDRDRYPVVGLEHLIPQEINLTEWSEGAENTFTKMFRKGDVLFGRRRAYLKKAAVAPFDGICSGDITVIEAISQKILPELLPFVIQNEVFFDFAVGGSAGSLSPRVKWEHLKNYEFELPGLDEQKRLAEALWAVNDTLEAYKRLLAKTDELVKARFVEMFGTPDSNIYGFEISTLKEIAIGSLSYGSTAPAVAYDGKTRYVRITDIIETGSLNDDIKSAAKTDEKYILSEGDILFTRTGATVGKTFLYQEKYGRCIYAGFLIKMIPDTSKVLPEYIFYFTKSDFYNNFVIFAQRVVAQPNINAQEYGDLKIIVPPLPLQNQFATFVHQTDKSKQELKQAVTDLEATYKRIVSDNLT